MANRKKEDRSQAPQETREEPQTVYGDHKPEDQQESTVNSETDEVEVAGVKVKRERGYWSVGDQMNHSLAQAYRAAEALKGDDESN